MLQYIVCSEDSGFIVQLYAGGLDIPSQMMFFVDFPRENMLKHTENKLLHILMCKYCVLVNLTYWGKTNHKMWPLQKLCCILFSSNSKLNRICTPAFAEDAIFKFPVEDVLLIFT